MELKDFLELNLTEKLLDCTISARRKKDEKKAYRVKIRPVKINDKLLFQIEEFVGRQAFHKNLEKEEAMNSIKDYLKEFSQAQFNLTDATGLILASKYKEGQEQHYIIKLKKAKEIKAARDLNHNKKKKYILEEGIVVPFLVDLGVMTKEGKIVNSRYDKFKQINRFLEFIEDILPSLSKDREQTIIDFGCGKSYLTFAMYYYLKVLKGYDIRVIGLDLKEDVINNCNVLARDYGYDKLNFYVGDIASYKDVNAVDMVVTLHACDTATDYALANAVKWGAKVILSVPCCQHEANKTIDNEILKPVMDYGILKERLAAIITDASRAKMLEANGYDTQILEFIDMEHTPKNLLIRAVKSKGENKEARLLNDTMNKALNVDLTLSKLI